MKLTVNEAMTAKARQFELELQLLRNRFYQLPAPDAADLNWYHIDDAAKIIRTIHAIGDIIA